MLPETGRPAAERRPRRRTAGRVIDAADPVTPGFGAGVPGVPGGRQSL
jgi:hypothetical protein